MPSAPRYEALELLRAIVPADVLARELRLDDAGMQALVDDPSSAAPAIRLHVAALLREHAGRTANAKRSHAIAVSEFRSTIVGAMDRVRDTLIAAGTHHGESAELAYRLAMIEELGPDVFDRLKSAEQPPKESEP